MSGQGDDGNSLHSVAVGWGIMLVIFAVLIWLVWYHFDNEIRDTVRWIRYGEMWFIGVILGLLDTIGLVDKDAYTITYQGREMSWLRGFEATPEFNKLTMDNRHMGYISALAMDPLRIPIAIFCALGALWAIFRGPKSHYRNKLGLDTLIERQSKTFPVIAPFIHFNPAEQPPRPPGAPVPADLPAFAEALGPEEWIAYNRIPVPDGALDEKRTERALIKQLGPRWRGWKKMQPYKQALLAAFALRAIRKRDESDDLLGELALCWHHKKGLRISGKLQSRARKILSGKDMASGILKKCNQHAFETTAMIGALRYARAEGGVLAGAQFVWLRAHDRTLWYPLNNLGRESFHMEALGAMAHYQNERRTERPIPVPKVEDCLESLRDYFGSKKARPIPALDYKKSKKRSIKKAV